MVWDAEEQGWRKGPWTPEEDKLLSEYVKLHGEGRWSSVARSSGLNRSGKSCRLRWVNYLRPGLKRGHLTPQEEAFIMELHALWGNKWSTIARYLPGRTDNEIKNYWRTHFKKKEIRNSRKQRKTKARVMKQNQQEEEEDHQQQQQKEYDDYKQNDIVLPANKKLPTSSEHTNEEKPSGRDDDHPVAFTFPAMEDQFLSMMYQDFASWPDDAVAAEDMSWDNNLWNLDDPADSNHMNNQRNCNRLAMQKNFQVSTLSFGGDSDNFCNGGFIF